MLWGVRVQTERFEAKNKSEDEMSRGRYTPSDWPLRAKVRPSRPDGLVLVFPFCFTAHLVSFLDSKS